MKKPQEGRKSILKHFTSGRKHRWLANCNFTVSAVNMYNKRLFNLSVQWTSQCFGVCVSSGAIKAENNC